MDIVILSKSGKPIYEQVYEQMASQILNGELKALEILPSIRTVARELSISVITVKKAWETLERDGLIFTLGGKGCFVSDNTTNRRQDKKSELASIQLKKDLLYYKNLNLSLDEFIELVKKEYKE